MIQPILDNVLVKPYPSDEITEGGLFVSEAHRPVSNKMKVIATGKGTKKNPMIVQPGETVFRVKECGNEIHIDGEKYFIVKVNWLLAKLN